MSDRQLTVAELLARAGKTEGAKDAPRRRRRSLEEGGISVAELTGSIPRVKEKPQEARHSNSPIDGPEDKDAESSTPAVAETSPRPESEVAGDHEPAEVPERQVVVETTPEVAAQQSDSAAGPAVKDKADDNAVEQESSEKIEDDSAEEAGLTEAEASPAEETTGIIPAVDESVAEKTEEEPEYAFFDDNGEPVSHLPVQQDTELESQDEEEEGQGSWLATVGLAVVGIILGIVVFLGFQRLWDSSLNNILVAVMAVAVTGVMVAVVHALRTARDGFSMALAAVVGLLMTFGPLLITLF